MRRDRFTGDRKQDRILLLRTLALVFMGGALVAVHHELSGPLTKHGSVWPAVACMGLSVALFVVCRRLGRE